MRTPVLNSQFHLTKHDLRMNRRLILIAASLVAAWVTIAIILWIGSVA